MNQTQKSDARENKAMLLGLLVRDKRCLVVGGGSTAARKALSLLEAGAMVHVVSPEVTEDLEETRQNPRLHWIERKFQASDTAEMFLVFAATDDLAVNQAVLNACREAGVLCGIVDRGWQEGDFISPAVFEEDGLIIGISTSGASCRRSRLVKETLRRHIELLRSPQLLVIGTDSARLSKSGNKPLTLSQDDSEKVGEMLKQIWGVHEFVLLRSEERLVLLAVASVSPHVLELAKRTMGVDCLNSDEVYRKQGKDAFYHLVEMALQGISPARDLTQLISEFETSLYQSVEHGWAGYLMEQWFARALDIADNIRKTLPSAVLTESLQERLRLVRKKLEGYDIEYEQIVRSTAAWDSKC